MRALAPLLFCTFAASVALAHDVPVTTPPDAPFAPIASLVALPDFIPGLGTLYVDPATRPAGPEEITLRGSALGERVWFSPQGLMETTRPATTRRPVRVVCSPGSSAGAGYCSADANYG